MSLILQSTSEIPGVIEQINPMAPNEDDHEEGLPVLPANHELLEKFQQALNVHLLRVKAQLATEIDELDHSIKVANEERQEVGANLYDLQLELEKQRKQLESNETEFKQIHEKRIASETNVVALKKVFTGQLHQYKEAKRNHNEKLLELNNMQTLKENFNKWEEQAASELQAAKRMVSKDAHDHIVHAEEKRKQDLLLYNLECELSRRELDLRTINEQLKENDAINKSLNRSLADANYDLDMLQQEHKRLIQAWNGVIIAVQQRDKILTTLKTQQIAKDEEEKVVQADILNTKKAAAHEMELNEKLEALKVQIKNDNEKLSRQIDKDEGENEKLAEQIDSFSKILDQTDDDMGRASTEALFLEGQLKMLHSTIAKQATKKLELETKIVELLQDNINSDKATRFRSKKLLDVQEQRRKLEINVSKSEHDLSNVLLNLERLQMSIKRKQAEFERIKSVEFDVSAQLKEMDVNLMDIQNSIKIKQRRLDTLNKELSVLIEAAGGKELSPDEIKIMALEKNIAELEEQIKESRGFWLNLQNHVVELSDKRAMQLNEIHIARNQLLIIEQKNIRINAELEQVDADDRETKRELANLTLKLERLDAKLHDCRLEHAQDEEACELNHRELMSNMRDAQMEQLRLEKELTDLTRHIDDAKEQAIEKHREALAWETKFKMAVETKHLLDDEYRKESDISCMRAEIHRMEVRYDQLKHAQEKLVQDLQNCVNHRDNIFEASVVKEKIGTAKTKPRASVKHQFNDIRNKIRQVNSEIKMIERASDELSSQQENAATELANRIEALESEKHQNELVTAEIEESTLLKQENLDAIVRSQNWAKKYRALANANRLPKLRNDNTLSCDIQEQRDVRNHLLKLTEELLTEFPNEATVIHRISRTLKHSID